MPDQREYPRIGAEVEASVACKVSPSRSGDRGGFRGSCGRRHRTAPAAHRSGGARLGPAARYIVRRNQRGVRDRTHSGRTPVYWSAFGQVVILAMIQVGGFGILTLASLVGLLISRRRSAHPIGCCR